jgi:CRP/FNR family transcriptional regulator, cyclic AMP receptor protein
MVSLLDHDRGLREGMNPAQIEAARTVVHATVVEVSTGAWPQRLQEILDGCPFGAILLEGQVLRTVGLGGVRLSSQLLGEGDLVWPTVNELAEESVVPVEVTWTVRETATLALLDERFQSAVRSYPEIVTALYKRSAEQAARLIAHRAVCELARVEDRLQVLLWLLAEQWGCVTPNGVVLRMQFTHKELAQLVGAQRPTITTALGVLAASEKVLRTDDGWLLKVNGQAGGQAQQDDRGGPPRQSPSPAAGTPSELFDSAAQARREALLAEAQDVRHQTPTDGES